MSNALGHVFLTPGAILTSAGIFMGMSHDFNNVASGVTGLGLIFNTLAFYHYLMTYMRPQPPAP